MFGTVIAYNKSESGLLLLKVIKTDIMNNLTTRGIYAIVNLTSKRRYIGSSINLNLRKAVHFKDLSLGIHHNAGLQRVYNIKGKDNFQFILLEERDDLSVLELLDLENEYIDNSTNPYNVDKAAFSGNYGRTHELEGLKDISGDFIFRRR